jgi:hypothetical protein
MDFNIFNMVKLAVYLQLHSLKFLFFNAVTLDQSTAKNHKRIHIPWYKKFFLFILPFFSNCKASSKIIRFSISKRDSC